MGTGSQYVVAAYAVVLFALVMYVVVLGLRAARMARESEVLARVVERRLPPGDEEARAPAEGAGAAETPSPQSVQPPAVTASSAPGGEVGASQTGSGAPAPEAGSMSGRGRGGRAAEGSRLLSG